MKSPKWLPGVLLLSLAGWLVHHTCREGADHPDSAGRQTPEAPPSINSIGEPAAIRSLKAGPLAAGNSAAVLPSFSSLQRAQSEAGNPPALHPTAFANQGFSPGRAPKIARDINIQPPTPEYPAPSASGFRPIRAILSSAGKITAAQSPPISEGKPPQSPEAADNPDSGSTPATMPQTHDFPAAWADLGDKSGMSPEDLALIDDEADALKTLIEDSSHPPASQNYSDLWDHSIRESDRWFRLRFGSRAWMRHHIAAHHLASTQAPIPE